MSRIYLINRFYLQKINLKKPLSRGSRFKIYFRLECRENRGSRQNFHGFHLSKDRVLINLGHKITKIILTHKRGIKICTEFFDDESEPSITKFSKI